MIVPREKQYFEYYFILGCIWIFKVINTTKGIYYYYFLFWGRSDSLWNVPMQLYIKLYIHVLDKVVCYELMAIQFELHNKC